MSNQMTPMNPTEAGGRPAWLEPFWGEDVPFIGSHPSGRFTFLAGLSSEPRGKRSGHPALIVAYEDWHQTIRCSGREVALYWGNILLGLPAELIRSLVEEDTALR